MSHFQAEYVNCGKRCSGCPHGPYWYEYGSTGGRRWKRYHGRRDPRLRHADGREVPSADDDIFSSRTASLALALRILGLPADLRSCDKEIAQAHYKLLVLTNHPDRGGEVRKMQRITAAWSYLRTCMDW